MPEFALTPPFFSYKLENILLAFEPMSHDKIRQRTEEDDEKYQYDDNFIKNQFLTRMNILITEFVDCTIFGAVEELILHSNISNQLARIRVSAII